MPYVSKAQARKFHADPALQKYTAEYDAATDFSKLPERAAKQHAARKALKRHRKSRSRR